MKLNLDIYYQPGFLETDAFLHKGEYEIFVCQEDNYVFIYPYIRKPLINGYYDITSPYGYCGPYSNDPLFFQVGERMFIEYTCKQGFLVSEFIRYHPIYNKREQERFKYFTSNFLNRTVVMLSENIEWNKIWNEQFSSTNRNLVRKMKSEGYVFELVDPAPYLTEFMGMYYQNMLNVHATQYYFFSETYFEKLVNKLGEKLVMARVRMNNTTYATSLFFLSGNIVTYFLSARNFNTTQIPATNFILSNMAEWGHLHGYSYFNLGGGLTNSKQDTLFKFKSNFSKDYVPFYIGKRIHNPEVYESLKRDWIDNNGAEKYETVKQVLQFYHQ
ncbi:GNAT family N-acetyltransferase [Chitinophaga sp.]|uniref:GNAT family N-acetyltransferase n=1 Tax=Chitinophaga sp. TaxID=1869181 RepID=UPI0025C36761|nr:GNAT family N-acetyltransferase [Chitinophaga sp.]